MRQFLFSKKELLPLISFLLLLKVSFDNFHFPCLILWLTTRWFTSYCEFVCLFVCPRFVQLLLAIWTKWLVMAPHYWRRHSNPKRVTNIEDIAQNCTQSGKLWRYGTKLQLHLLECAFKNLSTPSPLQSPIFLLRFNNNSIQTLCAEWYHVVHLRWHFDAISWSQSS